MATRTRYRRRWLTNPALLLALVLSALAALWITAPLWASVDRNEQRRWMQPTTGEAIRLRAMLVVVSAWFFFFGASVGSFLNVVVWRLPRRETLIWRPSRCPRCGAGIRPSDNVPVFGWLKLRGRCRACHTPISIRYPVVEFAAGALFLALAILELFAGGINLPRPASTPTTQLTWLIHDFPWSRVALYAYHCTLVSILLSWALIDHDRQRIPTGYVLFALLVGALAPVVAEPLSEGTTRARGMGDFSHPLHPVPAAKRVLPPLENRKWIRPLVTPLVGFAGGIALGTVLLPAAAGAGRRPRIVPAAAVIGVFVGWQAAASTVLVATGFLFVTAWRPRRFDDWLLGWLFGAVLAQLTLWRSLNDLRFWPGQESPFLAFPIFVLATFLLASFVGGIAESRRPYARL